MRLDGPSQISLFAYDNNTFVVESFLDKEAGTTVSTTGGFSTVKNLVTGESIAGEAPPADRPRGLSFGPPRMNFHLAVKPRSYVVLGEVK